VGLLKSTHLFARQLLRRLEENLDPVSLLPLHGARFLFAPTPRQNRAINLLVVVPLRLLVPRLLFGATPNLVVNHLLSVVVPLHPIVVIPEQPRLLKATLDPLPLETVVIRTELFHLLVVALLLPFVVVLLKVVIPDQTLKEVVPHLLVVTLSRVLTPDQNRQLETAKLLAGTPDPP